MAFYLAARYGRRLELAEYRTRLQGAGYSVCARWLDGDHQISDQGVPLRDAGERAIEGSDSEHAELRMEFADHDIADVLGCSTFVAFTEPPRAEGSRGGRHVELGLAIAEKRWRERVGRRELAIIVVGPRENLFCWARDVDLQFDTPDRFLAYFEDDLDPAGLGWPKR